MLSFDGRSGYIAGQVLACFCCLILLGNCGFQPLHGKRSQINAVETINGIPYVAVAAIPDRAGQIVRNKLLDLLQLKGVPDRPVFKLSVSLRESREGMAFQQDDSATRFNLRLTAQFKLTDIRTGQSLLVGNARAISAYNVVRSDYANLISRRDALRRAAERVAEGIRDRIAVYFSRSNS
ncbi:MAG: LPS assembly lipoprotein LptE [Alphaproteobacteria bacterium]|nr:LPS assembly lipoprotein LptE [Alphaproteobacteria bacterium]